ncbi:MAG: patatin-like phospholipase family protein [Patescibacteria group bacterium]
MKAQFFHIKPKIGLALGGGGPKGLAHIGVIKSLVKNGFNIDYIAGTSIGAVIGACYALRKDITSVENYVLEKNRWEMLKLLIDPSLKEGVLQGNRMRHMIEQFLGYDTQFHDLSIPFCAVAVDMRKSQKIALRSGNIVQATLASCAVPVVYNPVKTDGQLLADGGLISPVPVDTVKKMGADIVIAVNLYKLPSPDDSDKKLGLVTLGARTISIMMNTIASYETLAADLVVTPAVDFISWTSLLREDQKVSGIKNGEEAMDEKITLLKKLYTKKASFLPLWISRMSRLFGL